MFAQIPRFVGSITNCFLLPTMQNYFGMISFRHWWNFIYFVGQIANFSWSNLDFCWLNHHSCWLNHHFYWLNPNFSRFFPGFRSRGSRRARCSTPFRPKRGGWLWTDSSRRQKGAFNGDWVWIDWLFYGDTMMVYEYMMLFVYIYTYLFIIIYIWYG